MTFAKLGIRIRVKFRFLGVTLGELDRCVTVGLTERGPIVLGYPKQAAESARTALDERGVLVQYWLA